MGLFELFVSVLIVGISGINTALPLVAWSRVRDLRLVWVALGSVGLAGIGGLSTWAELPSEFRGPAPMPLYALILVLSVTVVLVIATVWPRRA